ncbi:MAG: hypothetical protein QOC92_634 [Acidimicrobiaceae bacterium]
MIDYSGRRVVVTGAASGIGQATASLLARLGAEVIGLDISSGVDISVDLRDPPDVTRAVELIDGPVHGLFNCAGLAQTRSQTDILSVNFIGLRHLCESMLPKMAEGSAIANVGSAHGMAYASRLSVLLDLISTDGPTGAERWFEEHESEIGEAYSFSKMAVIVYTMARAAEIGPLGVRMNSVSPGITDTPMLAEFKKAGGGDLLQTFPRPLGRDATADEQAATLAFLNSDAASYITGVNIFTDGGLAAAVLTGRLDPAALARAAAVVNELAAHQRTAPG